MKKINWTKVWKIVRVILEILVGLSAIGYYLECRELKDEDEEDGKVEAYRRLG